MKLPRGNRPHLLESEVELLLHAVGTDVHDAEVALAVHSQLQPDFLHPVRRLEDGNHILQVQLDAR